MQPSLSTCCRRLWRYVREDWTLLLENPKLFCCAQAGTTYVTQSGHAINGRFLHLVVNTGRVIRSEGLRSPSEPERLA